MRINCDEKRKKNWNRALIRHDAHTLSSYANRSLRFSTFRMRRSDLNAAYARRREVAEMKIERTKEVDKYFDKWNQITTRYICAECNLKWKYSVYLSQPVISIFDRYGHWTAPEYYQMAEENFQIDQEKKKKCISLEGRRENLRKFLARERLHYEDEMKSK